MAAGARRHNIERPYPSDKTTATAITLPIDTGKVRIVASEGFPLWEPLDALMLRNHRITLAYCDLSRQLAALIAGTDRKLHFDANWCTFAAWSSKTIGLSIETDPLGDHIHGLLARWPLRIQPKVYDVVEAILCNNDGAVYRGLAIGNRLVFLEIGTAIAQFIQSFAPGQADRPRSFDGYWAGAADSVAGLAHLDPSWVTTTGPDIQLLKQGLHAYYLAQAEPAPKAKAELVLTGNLFVAAYEQHRVDVYLTATLGLFTTTWLDRIMRGDDQGVTRVLRRMLEAPASTIYASLSTRYFLFLELPDDEILRVGKPVPSVGTGARATFPPDLELIRLPVLQALLTHYDRSDGYPKRTRTRNWARYPQRMNYITNLFRSRQKDSRLFDDVWTGDEQRDLLEGRLPQEVQPAQG
jgi:hypothetical protein